MQAVYEQLKNMVGNKTMFSEMGSMAARVELVVTAEVA